VWGGGGGGGRGRPGGGGANGLKPHSPLTVLLLLKKK